MTVPLYTTLCTTISQKIEFWGSGNCMVDKFLSRQFQNYLIKYFFLKNHYKFICFLSLLERPVYFVNQTLCAVSMYCSTAPIFSLEQRPGIMEEGFCSWAYCCRSCENAMYIHIISCSTLHVPPQLKSVFSCLPATLCPRPFC